jgi:general secretion pathway protein L
MSRQILAIDIRNDAAAAVLVNTGLKSHTVIGSAYVPIADQTDDGDALSQSLELLMERLKPMAPNVVVSLPADCVHFRFLHMPFKENNKIRQVLPFELEPTLPVPVDHLKIDFQKTAIGDQADVLAVAIDKSVLQNYMDKLGAANIRPQLVVPAGFSLIAQITDTEEPSVGKALFLDVGVEQTTLFAMRSNHIEMVRSMVSRVDHAAAVEALALRIRQTIAAWSDLTRDEQEPLVTYASGPGLQDAGRVDQFNQSFDMNVQTVDLRKWLTRIEFSDETEWQPHLMNEALALAILEAEQKPCPNFHRVSSPLRNYWSSYRPYLMVPAILLAVVVVIASISVLIGNYALGKRVDALDAKMEQVFKSAFPDTRLTTAPLEQMKSKLKELKKSGTGAGTDKNVVQTRCIDVLLNLSQFIPDSTDVIFNRMTVGPEEVTVTGETAAFNVVDDIKGRLEKSELFKKITISSANMDKSGNKVLFKLKIDL